MTLKEIVKEYLETHGFEGLGCEYCCCEVSDLMACGGMEGDPHTDCEAGYKIVYDNEECPCGEGCEWHIGPKEESEVTNE